MAKDHIVDKILDVIEPAEIISNMCERKVGMLDTFKSSFWGFLAWVVSVSAWTVVPHIVLTYCIWGLVSNPFSAVCIISCLETLAVVYTLRKFWVGGLIILTAYFNPFRWLLKKWREPPRPPQLREPIRRRRMAPRQRSNN